MKPAVFLDRDGVLIRPFLRAGTPFPLATLEELEVMPGAAEGLLALKEAGFVLLVTTNQPDVARGTTTRDFVEEVHARLAVELALDGFYVCYHDNEDGCACRKPLPGMLHAGAEEWDIDLERSYMVGDRWRDIEAGSAAGCVTVFIDYRYREKQPEHPDVRVANIVEAVAFILRKEEECKT
jgi:D-glycero-D-manno-heptose 1,7-bisphosphate phosphatase